MCLVVSVASICGTEYVRNQLGQHNVCRFNHHHNDIVTSECFWSKPFCLYNCGNNLYSYIWTSTAQLADVARLVSI